MGWLSAAVVFIALVRVVFLLWGICMCIHPLAHTFPICCPRNFARKVYCFAGFIYLAGLFPYSASFLTLDSWDVLGMEVWCYTFFRYLCMNCDIQMSACAFSSVLHMVMGLWMLIIYTIKAANKPLTKTQWYCRRWTGIMFLTPIAAFQGLVFMSAGKDIDGRRYPSDVQDCSNRTVVVWTSPVISDSDEMLRLQMLLCEERFSERTAKEYLHIGILVSAVCVFVLLFMYVGAVVAATDISSRDFKAVESTLRRRKKKFYNTELGKSEAILLLKCVQDQDGGSTPVESLQICPENSDLRRTEIYVDVEKTPFPNKNKTGDMFRCSCATDESSKEDQGMYLVSLMITVWVVIGKPIVVYLNSSYGGSFVDFGTHLLLTLSVLVAIPYMKGHVVLEPQQV